jgi:hypothetical protein
MMALGNDESIQRKTEEAPSQFLFGAAGGGSAESRKNSSEYLGQVEVGMLRRSHKPIVASVSAIHYEASFGAALEHVIGLRLSPSHFRLKIGNREFAGEMYSRIEQCGCVKVRTETVAVLEERFYQVVVLLGSQNETICLLALFLVQIRTRLNHFD